MQYIEREDCFVASSLAGDQLTLVDVVGPTMPKLDRLFTQLSIPGVRSIECAFTPDALGEAAAATGPLDTGLCVRSDFALPREPFRFPLTAQA